MQSDLDHLVVLAATLEDGQRWCERTLGLKPGSGGRHELMGTHNRLLRIDSLAYPQAYLEIIAIEPGAPTQRGPHQRRWFDLDDAELSGRIARDGPALAHWVVRTGDVRAACSAWQRLGIDRGPPLAAGRQTPQGLLQWQITVRDDGARLFDGCLPTLIEWGALHPVPAMAECGLRLERLRVVHPQHRLLGQAAQAIGLRGLTVAGDGPARLEALLQTPAGPVLLASA